MNKELNSFLLLGKDRDDLFLSNAEKTAFLILSEQICMLFKEHNENGDIDELKLINDFYEKIFVPVIRPIIHSNDNLIKELELQMKYGTRITLLPEQIDEILRS